VTDTSAKDQAFLSVSEAKERFGDNYQRYTDKITSAVNEVEGKKITYNGKPILACCHSISGGKTESAELLWGGSYPYLKPVESAGDVLSSGYLSEVTVSKEDFKTAFKDLEINFKGESDKWITDINRSTSGYILSLKLCGTELKGSAVRSTLKLRSTNFDVSTTDDNFVFSVRGYGHGVGMSQYGAQYMALQGSTYEEIIKWYFTGCVVE
ncbi:MAG: SpoIID/LytB domain-containing protein, partial [Clostridia bacterium]|nr:SpoIID/LytB domain-containing protein [Clostridia bacterium]